MQKLSTFIRKNAVLAFFILGLSTLVTLSPAAIYATGATIDLGAEAVTAGVPGADEVNGMGVLIANILRISMVIAALMVFINYIWAGFEWITGGDDKGKIEKARQKILQSTIGLIVLASVVALFMMLQNFLNIDVLQFSSTSGGGGGPGGGGNGGSGSCTITGQLEKTGSPIEYCAEGAAMVKCIGPIANYDYNHYTPCSCVKGPAYEKAGYAWEHCNN